MNKTWETKRGSKVWFAGTVLQVQAHGKDSSYDLVAYALASLQVTWLTEGTYCVTIQYQDGSGTNLGRYEDVEDALSLYRAIVEIVDKYGAWA